MDDAVLDIVVDHDPAAIIFLFGGGDEADFGVAAVYNPSMGSLLLLGFLAVLSCHHLLYLISFCFIPFYAILSHCIMCYPTFGLTHPITPALSSGRDKCSTTRIARRTFHHVVAERSNVLVWVKWHPLEFVAFR